MEAFYKTQNPAAFFPPTHAIYQSVPIKNGIQF